MRVVNLLQGSYPGLRVRRRCNCNILVKHGSYGLAWSLTTTKVTFKPLPSPDKLRNSQTDTLQNVPRSFLSHSQNRDCRRRGGVMRGWSLTKLFLGHWFWLISHHNSSESKFPPHCPLPPQCLSMFATRCSSFSYFYKNCLLKRNLGR